ncbi:DUF2793 domain-containing protein [Sphingomonas sp. CL5.1]|uniref:DUF2793 domain-containing protein n=1 Tax=Sphingomonas sp. CL5.1 TaxID=2653203 RepID=UPI001583AF61|nr:DUF2793 domain-containing protein [Sphingomonas sp. CL5.1]QKR98733.1 DUF2793 domain-containing protein [Sphingomonas sp. CL5.1]
MSDERSPRLALPLLQPGQAQKETDHNEALALLDIATQAAVLETGRDVPPSDPSPGECWIVGAAPEGAWAGHAGALAGWTPGGWRFVSPTPGMTAWSIAGGMPAHYEAGAWRLGEIRAERVLIGGVQVLGSRGSAIPDPSGGASVDAEARGAISTILGALRNHGLIA